MHELDCADTGRTSESQHHTTMTVRDGAKGAMTGPEGSGV